MNHKKIKKQINKINAFFDSISADDDVSPIERDLLLSYVRKLYESVLENNPSSKAELKKEASTKAIPKVKHTKEIVEPVERKPFEREPKEPTTTVEEVIVKDQVKETKKAPSPSKDIATPVATSNVSSDMASIFEKSDGTELSDKLSSLPIKDLTKSMSINERIFTIKELFGGDQEKFNTVLSDINQLENYEAAIDYLIGGVATEMEWDESDKIKKAMKFAKLVQRRFS